MIHICFEEFLQGSKNTNYW